MITTYRLVLGGLQDKIKEAEQQAEVDPQRIEALRIACAEVEAELSRIAHYGCVPSYAQAIRIVLAEDPRAWTVAELSSALYERGWHPGGVIPDRSLRAALARLKEVGDIERVDRGRYKICLEVGSFSCGRPSRP